MKALMIASLVLCAATLASSDPVRCCYPPHTTMTISVITAVLPDGMDKPILTQGRAAGHYDIARNLSSFYMTMEESGVQREYTSISNYTAGIEYQVDHLANRCNKLNLTDSLNSYEAFKCVPKSAKLVSRDTLGGGAEALMTETWSFTSVVPGVTDLAVSLTVEPSQCIPVTTVVSGRQLGSTSYSASSYADVTLSVPPGAFDIPAICHQQQQEQQPQEQQEPQKQQEQQEH